MTLPLRCTRPWTRDADPPRIPSISTRESAYPHSFTPLYRPITFSSKRFLKDDANNLSMRKATLCYIREIAKDRQATWGMISAKDEKGARQAIWDLRLIVRRKSRTFWRELRMIFEPAALLRDWADLIAALQLSADPGIAGDMGVARMSVKFDAMTAACAQTPPVADEGGIPEQTWLNGKRVEARHVF
jgi:hypothetical protein